VLHLLSLAVDEPTLRFPLHGVPDRAGGESAAVERPCTCGHAGSAHRHYRRGSDCGLCLCARFARPLSERLSLRG
jgi:hypothetical protein